MKVLLTADPELPVPPVRYGGIERIVDALVRRYRAIGHEVWLAGHRDSTSPAQHRVAWPAGSSRGTLATLRNTVALRRAVVSFQPDVVHSFSRLVYLLPLLRRGVPLVMSYQRHTGGRPIGWAARVAGRSLAFTGCSEFIAAMGRRAGGTWHAIPNFIEPAKIDFVPAVAPDAPLVFLSRIEAIKGAHLAVAIARRAGRRLLLAGNHATSGAAGEYWRREIVPHLGRDGIEYIGEVDDGQKNALLGRAAALVVPIQWDEPFGIVFAEALAAGTPVITCARGALPEIVAPGRTGWFIRNEEEGVNAVRRLPEIDRAACREVAVTRFSLEACAAQYQKIYDGLLAAENTR